jgi:hypothetical protein
MRVTEDRTRHTKRMTPPFAYYDGGWPEIVHVVMSRPRGQTDLGFVDEQVPAGRAAWADAPRIGPVVSPSGARGASSVRPRWTTRVEWAAPRISRPGFDAGRPRGWTHAFRRRTGGFGGVVTARAPAPRPSPAAPKPVL